MPVCFKGMLLKSRARSRVVGQNKQSMGQAVYSSITTAMKKQDIARLVRYFESFRTGVSRTN